MMVITSKLYLETIHEATRKLENFEEIDSINLRIQERVMKELEDWDRDDCMIEGYESSAFKPYEHLIPSQNEVLKEKVVPCVTCGDPYLKERMVFDQQYYCVTCSVKRGEETGKEKSETDPMKIRSEQGFAYEFGVLLFNVLSEHKDSLKITNQYDVVGNMTSLYNSLENVNPASVKTGFLSECQNYGIDTKESETLFEKVYEVLLDGDRSCPTCGTGLSMGTFSDGSKEPCDDCLLESDKKMNPELYANK